MCPGLSLLGAGSCRRSTCSCPAALLRTGTARGRVACQTMIASDPISLTRRSWSKFMIWSVIVSDDSTRDDGALGRRHEHGTDLRVVRSRVHTGRVAIAVGHQRCRRSQGSSSLPLNLPPERVSVRFSYMYVPPPLAPWYLPVPPVILYVYSLRCEPSSQVRDLLSPP